MGLFSKSYEPGGAHRTVITDRVFDVALRFVKEDPSMFAQFRPIAEASRCLQYEASDFPVTEIIGAFLLSHIMQEEANGVPEHLRMNKVELGRKDQVAYENYTRRYSEQLDREVLSALSAQAPAEELFVRLHADYLCGESQHARDYLTAFATALGASHEGLIAVACTIRSRFWLSEFAKANRS
jgi:hypothetical protein